MLSAKGVLAEPSDEISVDLLRSPAERPLFGYFLSVVELELSPSFCILSPTHLDDCFAGKVAFFIMFKLANYEKL